MDNVDKAVELLRELVGKLGQTVETLWPSAVRYVVVDALSGALIAGMLGGACLILGWRISKLWDEEDYDYVQVITITWVMTAIMVCLCWGIALSFLPAVFEPVGYLVHKALSGVQK